METLRSRTSHGPETGENKEQSEAGEVPITPLGQGQMETLRSRTSLGQETGEN